MRAACAIEISCEVCAPCREYLVHEHAPSGGQRRHCEGRKCASSDGEDNDDAHDDHKDGESARASCRRGREITIAHLPCGVWGGMGHVDGIWVGCGMHVRAMLPCHVRGAYTVEHVAMHMHTMHMHTVHMHMHTVEHVAMHMHTMHMHMHTVEHVAMQK